MPPAKRLRSDRSSDSTKKYIDAYIKDLTFPLKETDKEIGGEALGRLKGLKCLANAVLERNACEKLHTDAEEKLKALDRKVQAKMSAIVTHKRERKKLKPKLQK
jgi:hypothetical protein